MSFSSDELSILETLTLNKVVQIRCKKLELRMNKDLIDRDEYVKEEATLESQLNEMLILHDKIIKYLEE